MEKNIIVGIDASNLRGGGGITHLIELLREFSSEEHQILKVIVFGCAKTLERLPERQGVQKKYERLLDKNIFYRFFWQNFLCKRRLKAFDCNVLFAPGGYVSKHTIHSVTMSQNMLPFETEDLCRPSERKGLKWRFIFYKYVFRIFLLRKMQLRSFKRATKTIFLTEYARRTISPYLSSLVDTEIIPHGVNTRFCGKIKAQLKTEEYSISRPFRLVYVSTIDLYKHQWNVAEAVATLRQKGLPIEIAFIGSVAELVRERFENTLSKVDPNSVFSRYLGEVSYDRIHDSYKEADAIVFASTVENMPNILLEAMSSGRPLACSNYGPMPEILKDAGLYFDPRNITDIERCLSALITAPSVFREELARKAQQYVSQYSWSQCAQATFALLRSVR